MTEPTKPASSSGWGFSMWILVILVVYALSIGPVAKVVRPNPTPAIEAFYAPLQFLADYVPPVGAFYVWYFELIGVQ